MGCARALRTLVALAVVGLPAAPRAQDAALVATRPAPRGPYELTLPERVGMLRPDREQVLAFEVSGRLLEVAHEDSAVEAGAVVAQLDDALEQAALRRAELLVAEARTDLARLRTLRTSDVASRKALDDATTALGLRSAELDSVREQVRRKRIEAPWTGVVVDRRVEPGEVVAPGAPLATLMKLDALRVEVTVPGYTVASVAVGQTARVRIPAANDLGVEGVVDRVAAAAPDGDHLFDVEIRLPNAEGRLRSGMAARVEIVTGRLEQAVPVPLAAVVARDADRVVFFVADGRARGVSVARALIHADRALLLGPVPSGEVIVRGQHDLQEGQTVRIDNSVLGAVTSP